VEILDLEGNAYRFKRDVDDYTEYHKLESYEDKEDAKEAFANKVAKARLKLQESVIVDRDVRQDDFGCQFGEAEESNCSGSDEEPPSQAEAAAPQRSAQGAPATVAPLVEIPDTLPLSPGSPGLPNLTEGHVAKGRHRSAPGVPLVLYHQRIHAWAVAAQARGLPGVQLGLSLIRVPSSRMGRGGMACLSMLPTTLPLPQAMLAQEDAARMHVTLKTHSPAWQRQQIRSEMKVT
jgi:hypothetical protein